MIEIEEDKTIHVLEKNWQALHPAEICGGPAEIKINQKTVISDIKSAISGIDDSQCITRKIK